MRGEMTMYSTTSNPPPYPKSTDRHALRRLPSPTGRRAILPATPIFALLLVLLIFPLSLQAANPTSPATPTVAFQADLCPAPDTLDDLIEILKQIEKELGKAKKQAEGNDSSPGNDQLEIYLDNTQLLIDQIFDPYQDPSLDPVDAGSIDPTVSPITLSEYADVCLDLAADAEDEAEFASPPDHDVIGSKLKTIDSLLPGYRLAAGL